MLSLTHNSLSYFYTAFLSEDIDLTAVLWNKVTTSRTEERFKLLEITCLYQISKISL